MKRYKGPLQDIRSWDREFFGKYLEDFVPSKVFDLHAHLFSAKHFNSGNLSPFLRQRPNLGLRNYQRTIAQLMPNRVVDGLFFGWPNRGNDRPAINRWIARELGDHAGPRSCALALVSPKDDPAAVADEIRELGLAGIKSYHVYASAGVTMHAGLTEYFPEWMWEICDSIKGVLMIHLVRNEGIADQRNQAQLRRLCRKYPNCRVVLAHVARSFNYRYARRGLAAVADLDNVWVDTSVVTETESMRCAIETLGYERVLFGTDYPVVIWRGRCVAMGDSFFWITPHSADLKSALPPGKTTLVGLESLLCLREACEDCGLARREVRSIFYDNAMNLLAPLFARRG